MDFKIIIVIFISEESLCKYVTPAMHVLFLQVIPFLSSLLSNGYVPVVFSVYKDLAYRLSSESTAGEYLKVCHKIKDLIVPLLTSPFREAEACGSKGVYVSPSHG